MQKLFQGPEDCRDKTMVSTIQKPMEHCELQPQRHCSLVTKLVPHLTTREVCKVIPKEICVLKLVNPHPVKKPITLKWCTKKKPPGLPSYKPSKPATNSYLPPKSPPQYQPSYGPGPHRREGGTGTEEDPFIITVDGEKFAELNQLPQDFNQILSTPIRQVRGSPGPTPVTNNVVDPIEHNINTLNAINTANHFHPHQPHHTSRGPVHKRHTGPHSGLSHHGPHPRHELLDTAGSDVSVHVVTPEPVKEDTTTSEPLHVVQV